jgi:hypothetical protein
MDFRARTSAAEFIAQEQIVDSSRGQRSAEWRLLKVRSRPRVGPRSNVARRGGNRCWHVTVTPPTTAPLYGSASSSSACSGVRSVPGTGMLSDMTRGPIWIVALPFYVACGGDAFSAGGSGGTIAGSGGSSTGGSVSGGAGGLVTGSGGAGGLAGSGGSGGIVYPPPRGECTDHTQCVAVVDTADPCFSSDCGPPLAASRTDMANNPCLVPWEQRYEPVQSMCRSSEPVACPALCAVQPACIQTGCSSEQCQMELIYEITNCPNTDCTQLNADRIAALDAARACSSAADGQCSADVTVPDACGCAVPVNPTSPDGVEQAQATYDAWVNAGCGPACAAPCILGTAATCSVESASCVWAQ